MSHAPEEILPGIQHWTAPHPAIGIEVSSYWLDGSGVLIDPLVPPDAGLEWFASRPAPPAAIVLSNRLHGRDTEAFVERFGCPVFVPRSGLQQFAGRPFAVTPYDPGDELPGGLVVHAVGALCPDDMALHLLDADAVFFADGVVLGGGSGAASGGGGGSGSGSGGSRRGRRQGEPVLGFVPDGLMDDPPTTKRGLLAALSGLLDDLQFRHVLCAHGGPLVDQGRTALEELVRSGGRTAFEW
jgi:hypothetical protein